MIEDVALKIIRKWLKKGNMARCMRDILPHSHLTLEEREEVAKLIHDFVRFKKFYDFILEEKKMEKSGENYIKISKNRENYEEIEKKIPPKKFFEIRYSSSKEVAKILEKYKEFVGIINREPETHLSVNLIKSDRENVIKKLKEDGLKAEKYLPESSVITESRGRYSQVVKNYLAQVQDSSSQMLSKITMNFGNKILDYCSGSGGKSLSIAFLSKNTKEIYAYDVDERKLKNLRKRAENYSADIKLWKNERDFDVVLVDAPCSGIGAAARNPVAKYQEDLKKYPKLQYEILEEVRNYVAKNGYLIYSVCTFNPDETHGVIDRFLKVNKNFKLENLKFEEEYMKKERDGYFITLGDIIYFSVMRREK